MCQGESYLFITMDLAMPVLDGLRATEIVRQHMYRGATTPIVAVSSFDPMQPPLLNRADALDEGDALFSDKVHKGKVMLQVNSSSREAGKQETSRRNP